MQLGVWTQHVAVFAGLRLAVALLYLYPHGHSCLPGSSVSVYVLPQVACEGDGLGDGGAAGDGLGDN